MKKITLILAAIAVCAGMLLTGCGENENGSDSNNNSNNSADAENNGNDSSNDESGDNGDSSADVKYTRSSIDENGKFVSEFLGIGADFNTDDWLDLGDDYLATYNGGAETDEELMNRLENGDMLYEMMVGKESGSNINIVIQNFGVLGLSFTEEEYIDTSLETTAAQLEQSGIMTDPKASKSSVTFAGASRYALDVEGTSDDFNLYERIIVIKRGNYMGMITITAQSAEERDEFTGLFYAL